MFIFLLFSSISSFFYVPISMLASLTCSIPNLFSRSLTYLLWLMKMSSFVCLICNPIKKFNFSIMLILNSSCLYFAKSLQRDSLVAPNIISSTYICTIKIFLPFLFIKRMVSILPMLKSFLMRKDFNLSYQALRASFKPYKAFLRFKTLSRGDVERCGKCL